MYDGLNAFIARLEEEGELVRIRREVDPHLDLGEIADRTMKAGGPALLFERPLLKDGTVSKFPLLINAYGSRKRMSLALGVGDLEEHARNIAELVHTKAPRSARELAEMATKLPALASAVPRKASRASCQEVVLTGDEVNLEALPVMTSWPEDGGPFFTLPNVITRDPDTGIRNIGMDRMQRLDRNTTAMHWQIHKTGARHFRRAKELGKRLEVAVAFGGDPALTYAATAPLPDGIDEWMFAGFLRGKSVEYVPCKTVDLDVPADADFVLEGYVDPAEEMADEGPVEKLPRFHVTCITHRKNAVYPATVVGPPPMEDEWLGKATERLFLPLVRMMFPEIVDMNLPASGAFHNLVIVSIKKQFPLHAARVAHGLWGASERSFSKVICVVDEDVDVQNTAEVAWRLLANLDPKRDISIVDHGGKMAIDGTKKWAEEGSTRERPSVCRSDAATKARVDTMWSDLGIDLQKAASSSSATVPRVEPELARRGAAPAAHASGNREMFDRIAPSYDRMNKLMTLGIDRGWRKKAVDMIRKAARGRVLDSCAGTLDLAALIEETYPDAKVVASDASAKMLDLGNGKTKRVETVVGDALALPFDDASFDAVICGFGMRNLSDLKRGVREARRVLKPGGVFVTLELFQPRGATSRLLHGAGLRYALPALGAAIANDREAYAYLAESMEGFVTREAYEQLLAQEGFATVTSTDLTLGMAAIVRAEAKAMPARAFTNGATA